MARYAGIDWPDLPKQERSTAPAPSAPPATRSYGGVDWRVSEPRYTPPKDEQVRGPDYTTLSPMQQVNRPAALPPTLPSFNPATMSAMRQVNDYAPPTIPTTREAPIVPSVRNAAVVPPLAAPWLNVANNVFGALPELVAGVKNAMPAIGERVNRFLSQDPAQINPYWALGDEARAAMLDRLARIPGPEEVRPTTFAGEIQRARATGSPISGGLYLAQRPFEVTTEKPFASAWLASQEANASPEMARLLAEDARLAAQQARLGNSWEESKERSRLGNQRKNLAREMNALRTQTWQERGFATVTPEEQAYYRSNAPAALQLATGALFDPLNVVDESFGWLGDATRIYRARQLARPALVAEKGIARLPKEAKISEAIASGAAHWMNNVEAEAAITRQGTMAPRIADKISRVIPAFRPTIGMNMSRLVEESTDWITQAVNLAFKDDPELFVKWAMNPHAPEVEAVLGDYTHTLGSVQAAALVRRVTSGEVSEAAKASALAKVTKAEQRLADLEAQVAERISKADAAAAKAAQKTENAVTSAQAQVENATKTLEIKQKKLAEITASNKATASTRMQAEEGARKATNALDAAKKRLADATSAGGKAPLDTAARQRALVQEAQDALVNARQLADEITVGEMDMSKVRKIIAEAGDDKTAAIEQIAAHYEEAAKSFFGKARKVTARDGKTYTVFDMPEKGKLTKGRDAFINFINTFYMGYNPGYAFRNAANNLLTAVADGVNPFAPEKAMLDFFVAWGKLPMATMKGYGPGADLAKGSQYATEMAQRAQTPMRAYEPIVAGLKSWKHGPTQKMAQEFETMASQRIMYRNLEHFWNNVWPRTIQDFKKSLLANPGPLTPEQVEYFARELRGALNVQKVKEILNEMSGAPQDLGRTLTPEAAEKLAQGGGTPAIKLGQDIAKLPPNVRSAVVEINEGIDDLFEVAKTSIDDLRSTIVSKIDDIGEAEDVFYQNLLDYFNRAQRIVDDARAADTELVGRVIDQAENLSAAERNQLWSFTRQKRQTNRKLIMDELDRLDAEVLPGFGFEDDGVLRQAKFNKQLRDFWDRSDTLMENYWEDRARGVRGGTASALWDAMKREQSIIWDQEFPAARTDYVFNRNRDWDKAWLRRKRPPKGGGGAGGVGAAPTGPQPPRGGGGGDIGGAGGGAGGVIDPGALARAAATPPVDPAMALARQRAEQARSLGTTPTAAMPEPAPRPGPQPSAPSAAPVQPSPAAAPTVPAATKPVRKLDELWNRIYDYEKTGKDMAVNHKLNFLNRAFNEAGLPGLDIPKNYPQNVDLLNRTMRSLSDEQYQAILDYIKTPQAERAAADKIAKQAGKQAERSRNLQEAVDRLNAEVARLEPSAASLTPKDRLQLDTAKARIKLAEVKSRNATPDVLDRVTNQLKQVQVPEKPVELPRAAAPEPAQVAPAVSEPESTIARAAEEVEPPTKVVGSPQSVNGIDAVVASAQRIDDVDYELYRPVAPSDKRGIIRVADSGTGQLVTLKTYPDFSQAETEYAKAIKASGGAPPVQAELPAAAEQAVRTGPLAEHIEPEVAPQVEAPPVQTAPTAEEIEFKRKADEYEAQRAAHNAKVDEYNQLVARGQKEVPGLTRLSDAETVGRVAKEHDAGRLSDTEWQGYLDTVYRDNLELERPVVAPKDVSVGPRPYWEAKTADDSVYQELRKQVQSLEKQAQQIIDGRIGPLQAEISRVQAAGKKLRRNSKAYNANWTEQSGIMADAAEIRKNKVEPLQEKASGLQKQLDSMLTESHYNAMTPTTGVNEIYREAALKWHDANPDTNEYSSVLRGLEAVLYAKGIPKEGNTDLWRELGSKFHDPLSSFKVNTPVEDIAKAMNLTLAQSPGRMVDGFNNIVDARLTRRNAEILEALSGGQTPSSKRLYDIADKTEQDAIIRTQQASAAAEQARLDAIAKAEREKGIIVSAPADADQYKIGKLTKTGLTDRQNQWLKEQVELAWMNDRGEWPRHVTFEIPGLKSRIVIKDGPQANRFYLTLTGENLPNFFNIGGKKQTALKSYPIDTTLKARAKSASEGATWYETNLETAVNTKTGLRENISRSAYEKAIREAAALYGVTAPKRLRAQLDRIKAGAIEELPTSVSKEDFAKLVETFENMEKSGTLEKYVNEMRQEFAGRSPFALGITAPGTQHAFALMDAISSSLKHTRDTWRGISTQPSVPVAQLTPEQALYLRTFVNKELLPKMSRDKFIVGQVATDMRNFALGDYTHRRNIHEFLSWIYPYAYWYTFTFQNWAMRLAQHPSYVANYARYRRLLRDKNREHYKELTGDPNAELPEYNEASWFFKLPFADTELQFNLEDTLNPLKSIIMPDFQPKELMSAPGGPLFNKANSFGPTTHPLFGWLYAAWLNYAAKNPDAAAQVVSYVLPQERILKGATALAREKIPGAEKIIPAGGWTPSQLLPWNKGGSIWDRRQIPRDLVDLYTNGLATMEEVQQAGYSQDTEKWGDAAQKQAIRKLLPNLASFLFGQGFKPRDMTDLEIDKMWNERIQLTSQKAGMSAESYSNAWDALREKYPWMDVYAMARQTDPIQRLESFYWLIKDRLPPGKQGTELLTQAGLTWDDIDKFKASKYDLTNWAEAEIAKFKAGIEKLAGITTVPNVAERAQREQYWVEKNAIDQAIEKATGHTRAEYDAANAEYYAEGADKDAVRKKYPWLEAGWEASRKAKATSPTYTKYNPPEPQTAEQKKAAALAAKYDAAEKKFGAQVAQDAGAWSDMTAAQKADFKKRYPERYAQMKNYWNFIYGDTQTGASSTYGPYVPLYRTRTYGGGGGGGRGGGGYSGYTAPAYERWTLDDFNGALAEERDDDPSFDTLVSLMFDVDTIQLASTYYAMSAAEKAAWRATYPDKWARLLKFLMWLLQQRGVKTDYTTMLSEYQGTPTPPALPAM